MLVYNIINDYLKVPLSETIKLAWHFKLKLHTILVVEANFSVKRVSVIRTLYVFLRSSTRGDFYGKLFINLVRTSLKLINFFSWVPTKAFELRKYSCISVFFMKTFLWIGSDFRYCRKSFGLLEQRLFVRVVHYRFEFLWLSISEFKSNVYSFQGILQIHRRLALKLAA